MIYLWYSSRGAPAMQLSGLSEPFLCARFCPVLFHLPSDGNKENEGQESSSETCISLPYRVVYAVATITSVILYASEVSSLLYDLASTLPMIFNLLCVLHAVRQSCLLETNSWLLACSHHVCFHRIDYFILVDGILLWRAQVYLSYLSLMRILRHKINQQTTTSFLLHLL